MATTKIGNSELILNPDGSVYHLHLLPEDLAETILLVGDPDRVKKVSKHFDRIEIKKQKREFITHTGYIGKKRLSVLSTGIGTDNIDIVLNELDALVNVNLKSRTINAKKKSLRLVRLGTSGLCKKT
jgi:uridine phosphorylase